MCLLSVPRPPPPRPLHVRLLLAPKIMLQKFSSLHNLQLSHTPASCTCVGLIYLQFKQKETCCQHTHIHTHTRKLVNQSHFKLSMLRCMDRQKDSSLPSTQNITPLAYRQSDVFTVSLSSCLSLALHSTVVLLKANLFKCLRCDYSSSYCKATVKSSWFFSSRLGLQVNVFWSNVCGSNISIILLWSQFRMLLVKYYTFIVVT